MDERERIEKDLRMFEENVSNVKKNAIIEMAVRYYKDAKYYFKKGDHFTAFGCINYAHGLLDAVRKEFKGN
ncbi:MAG: DUF357 domain-containing protein [Thermoplasmata archaeon]|nr:MAG: DUF357 domain-containing protein [Thermoplasmata archaeon]